MPATSVYRWEPGVDLEGGAPVPANAGITEDAEVLLVIKTMADRFEAMQARLVALHPYDVPEVLAIEPVAGAAPYFAWLERETRPA